MKKLRIVLSLLIVIVLVFAFLVLSRWITTTTGYTIWNSDKLRIAQCLASKDAILYVSENCPQCEKQKEIFGTEINYINIINCNKTPEKCDDRENLPTWKINNELYSPIYFLKDFEKLFGCQDA